MAFTYYTTQSLRPILSQTMMRIPRFISILTPARSYTTQPARVFKPESYHSWATQKIKTFTTRDGICFKADVWARCRITSISPDMWLTHDSSDILDSFTDLIDKRLEQYDTYFKGVDYVNAVCTKVKPKSMTPNPIHDRNSYLLSSSDLKLESWKDSSITCALTADNKLEPVTFDVDVSLTVYDYQQVCNSYLLNMWAKEDRWRLSLLIISCTGLVGYAALLFIRSVARLEVCAATCNHEAALASRSYKDIAHKRFAIYAGLVGVLFIIDWICDMSIFSNPYLFGLPLFLIHSALQTD